MHGSTAGHRRALRFVTKRPGAASPRPDYRSDTASTTHSAVMLTTRRGVLANHVALLRPKTSGFYAFTPKPIVCRQLSLTRGVTAFQISFAVNIEETIVAVTAMLKEKGLVRPGTPIVIVSDILSSHFAANSILLHHA